MVLLQMFEDSHSSFCTSMQSLQCQQSIEVQDTCFLCFLMRPFVNSLVISWESECMLILYMILRLWFGAYLKLGPRANSLKKTRQLGSDWARVSTRKVDGHWPPGTICGQKVAIWVFEHLGPFSSGNLTALLRINIEKNDFPEGCPVARGSGPRCLFLTSSFLNAGPFKALQPLYFFVGQMWLQRNGRTFAGIVDPPSIVYLINFVSCQFWLPTSCWKEFKPKDLCEKMVKAENRWCQIWKNGYCKLL